MAEAGEEARMALEPDVFASSEAWRSEDEGSLSMRDAGQAEDLVHGNRPINPLAKTKITSSSAPAEPTGPDTALDELDSGVKTEEEALSASLSKGESELDKDDGEAQQGFKEEPDVEITSIIDQFDDAHLAEDGEADNQREVVPDPYAELEKLGSHGSHPPRTSSLEKAGEQENSVETHEQAPTGIEEVHSPSTPARDTGKQPSERPFQSDRIGSPVSTRGGPVTVQSLTPHSPPPQPGPEIRFNFHLFLEQLRHRTADPVAKYLRSFLTEFGKKQWAVHEQVKIISDFLTFISGKMAQCEIWRDSTETEFDNAREGMEKLVMNRLYAQTFSPGIPPPAPTPANRNKRKTSQKAAVVGRHGQHQEDVERDHILDEKMQIFGWVQEEHLEIAAVPGSGRRFLVLAQQELLKIKNYRAPRDKVICVLNCCKVIFGLLRSSTSSDTSADSFMPLLIYTMLRARPESMVSNIQYIFRFRNQDKLGGEAGYYLSSLMGAIQFVENLDRTALKISDEDFEKNVEAAVSLIAERQRRKSLDEARGQPAAGLNEKQGHSHRHPEQDSSGTQSSREPAELEGDGPVSGLLRSVQRPLTNISKLFSDDQPPSQRPTSLAAQLPPADYTPRSLSPAMLRLPGDERGPRSPQGSPSRQQRQENAARQASRETAQAQRMERAEHVNIVETLSAMFPSLEKDVISDIVLAKKGRVGAAVDACLALTS